MRGQHALLLNGDTRHTLEKSESTPGTTSLMSSIAGTRLRNGLTAFNRRSKLVTATLHAELTHRAFVLLRTNDHDFSSLLLRMTERGTALALGLTYCLVADAG